MLSYSVKSECKNNNIPHPISPLVYDNSAGGNQYKCGHCQISFILQEDLISHLTVGNPEIKFEKIREECSYTCTICNLNFDSFKAIMQHYGKIHFAAKDYPCRICGKMFKDKYAVGYHMKNVHDSTNKVICEICTKVCYNKYVYKTHYQKCSIKSSNIKAKS